MSLENYDINLTRMLQEPMFPFDKHSHFGIMKV